MWNAAILLLTGLTYLSFLYYLHIPSFNTIALVSLSSHHHSINYAFTNNNLSHLVSINRYRWGANVSILQNQSTLAYGIDGRVELILDRFHPFVIVHSVIQEEAITYKAVICDLVSLSTRSISLAGSLRFALGATSVNNSLIYTRKMDSRMFRTFNLLDYSSISGPKSLDTYSRVIAIKPFVSRDNKDWVFVVQYIPKESENTLNISLSLFRHENNVWANNTIWTTNLPYLIDDVIPADELEKLYFLSNPVIGCSIDDKMLAFVFLGNLFVLEDLNGSKGMLNYHPISFGITGPDFEVEMIHILENKNVIVLCSQSKKLTILKRLETPDESAAQLYQSLTLIGQSVFERVAGPTFLYFLFETIFLSDISAAISQINLPIPKAIEWQILGTWTNDAVGKGDLKIRHISSFSHDQETFLQILLEDNSVLILDPYKIDSNTRNLLFTKPRYGMLASIFFVTTVFVISESGVLPERSNYLFTGLAYFIFVSLILSAATE